MARIDSARWVVVSPLLDELLDVDNARRSERLAQIRATDPALADGLESLLAQQTRVEREGFLTGSAVGLGVEATAGQIVGSYTLERPLGHGGMGTCGSQRRSDGRYEGHAAIKFLDSARFSRGGVERFQREGSVLARLTHPNIARLIDAGVTERRPAVPGARVRRGRSDRSLVRRTITSTPRLGCACSSKCWPRSRTRTAS